jgi:DNA mismatch repair protein PMS2
LGFRGEALSSLCALSDLTILTKHSTSEHATKITYDRNGRIINETLCAREQGTTVTLENLFSTLPVRRKEFMKNLKREFNKMCHLLYAYCLVSKGVKFSCTNTTNKGSRNTVVSTDGLSSIRENIINVFGAKQISSLIEVDSVRPEEPILSEYGIQLVEGEPLPFSFDLFVSSVMHGSGRSTNDRQFFLRKFATM